MFLKKGFNVLIDGQWGSTGKGKVAAWAALNNHIDIAVSDFQANAGHTTVMDDGRKFVVKTVPSSAVNEDCILCISPASTFSVEQIMKEIDMFNLNESRLRIHPHAMIIMDHHKEEEAIRMQKISSTCQGVGAALADKIMRTPRPKLAMDIAKLQPFITDTTLIINSALEMGGTVLAETAQGLDLSINHGKTFPYVTSRDITVGSALNNAGVSPYWMAEVIGIIRTYPIRVGNAYDKSTGKMIGTSGGFYSDQKELTWSDISHMSGSDEFLQEKTTVTQKVRRIFTFSPTQYTKFLKICRPTQIAITFADYLDYKIHGSSFVDEVIGNQKVREFLGVLQDEHQEANFDPGITYIGTGPANGACITNSHEGFQA